MNPLVLGSSPSGPTNLRCSGTIGPIYACYAIAMFSGRDDFAKFHAGIGETCDYDAMRGEVAHNHFSGDANFDVGDIVSLYSEHGSDASHSESHDSGSGHGHSGH